MINKTEKEVMRSWKGKKQMMVSIACVAYNQDHFISETLDGFLMQETSFPFEILINDDASSDRTAEIIKEYEDKFPNIVKPVYQSENQFSQGLNPMVPLFPRAKGRYVAICDGDDYWDDKKKLEIQFGEMEKHLDVNMSFHPAHILSGGKIERVMSKHSDRNKIFTSQEVILGKGGFCPTESLLIRRKILSSLPDWAKTAVTADYLFQIMGAENGGALYIDRCMTVHRIGNEGSWTHSVFKTANNSEIRKESLLSLIQMLNLLNEFYDKKFQKEFNKVIHDRSLDFVTNISLGISAREEVFNIHKGSFSIKQKILWYLLYGNKILQKVLNRILSKGARGEFLLKPLGKLRRYLKT